MSAPSFLTYVPVAVFTAVVTGFAGIAVAIVKVWPKLRELSSVRLNDAIEAWKKIADAHAVRISLLEQENILLRGTIRDNEQKCADDIAALRRQLLQLQESTISILRTEG